MRETGLDGSVSPDPTLEGDPVRLGCWLVQLPARTRLAGEQIIMELSVDQVTWMEFARGLTDSNGDLFVSYVFPGPGTYLLRCRYEGRTDVLLPDISNVTNHTVTPIQPPGDVMATLILATSPNPSRPAEVVNCTGRLTRVDTGGGVAGATVIIQVNGTDVPGAMGATDPTGAYAIPIVFQLVGSYSVQARSLEVLV